MAVFTARGFPRSITLRDGTSIMLRPLTAGDAPALGKFFASLPAQDRFFMKDDVLAPETVERWTSRIDHSRALALVALAGDEIVGDAVVLKHANAARRHLAEARVNIAPAYQGKGLGTVLIRHLAEIAWDAEVEMLGFELVEGVQDAAIEAVRGIGAFHLATLASYLRDQDGEPRSLAIYQIPLGTWFRF